MSIKILHAADFHLDSPFGGTGSEKAYQRRAEQRLLLGDIAALANSEDVQLVLLAGDLFDSAMGYHETMEAIADFCGAVKAQIVIAPGNHDFFVPGSPWARMTLPENVHIFTSPAIHAFEFPDLGVRVWGAGFTASYCPPLLGGFRATGDGMTEIMVMHGDITGGAYNPIDIAQIEESGLDYLALGHIHTYSGILQAGGTAYAYPGCPEGRGFDETGDKGVIIGTVGKGETDLRFVSTARRRYESTEVNVTGRTPEEALREAAEKCRDGDIARFTLTGEYGGEVNLAALKEMIDGRFFSVEIISRVTLPKDIWDGSEENSLRGLFLKNMRERYDAAGEEEKETLLQAVKYGLAALDGREEWAPV